MLRMVIGLAVSLLFVTALAADTTEGKKSKAENEPAPVNRRSAEKSKDASDTTTSDTDDDHAHEVIDYFGLLFVFVLAAFIGLGVVARVSRLLHTPLMSLTNAISAIAVIGSIIVTGYEFPTNDYPLAIRIMGAIALVASMTNVVSGFLITDRMLKMFKQTRTKEKS